MRSILISFLILFASSQISYSQTIKPYHLVNPNDVESKLLADPQYIEANRVVDSIMSKMSNKEKIAQLFIVQYSSRQNSDAKKKVEKYIKKDKIGGLILMYDDVYNSATYTNKLKSISKLPLLMTIDGEWGLGMRFSEIESYPRQAQLGALPSPELVYEMGYAIGRQCRLFGINVNFAPDVDVNNNLKNPVIHTRSFGEDKEIVADYGIAYMKGMQDAGIMTSAKHFPGHGDTDVDSHHSLPVLNFDKKRLDSMELYPFKRLIAEGVDMVMVGHLDIPSLDDSGTPSSLSHNIMTGLLKEELGYKGIVITDALEMKGVSNHLSSEEIPLASLKGGTDIILMPDEVTKSIKVINKALRKRYITQEELDQKCKKVLLAKYSLGLLPNNRDLIDINSLADAEKFWSNYDLNHEIAQKSITLMNPEKAVNLGDSLAGRRGALLTISGNDAAPSAMFESSLRKYKPEIDVFNINNVSTALDMEELLDKVERYDYLIISYHNTDRRPARQFGIIPWQQELVKDYIRKVCDKQNVIISYFGSPYALQVIDYNYGTFLVGFENSIWNIDAMAQIIFGDINPVGKIPLPL